MTTLTTLDALGLAAALAVPAAAFTPTDPLVPRQWYLAANHTYDSSPEPPAFAPVRIAILDSGIDAGHPELMRHVVAAKSFVGRGAAASVRCGKARAHTHRTARLRRSLAQQGRFRVNGATRCS